MVIVLVVKQELHTHCVVAVVVDDDKTPNELYGLSVVLLVMPLILAACAQEFSHLTCHWRTRASLTSVENGPWRMVSATEST